MTVKHIAFYLLLIISSATPKNGEVYDYDITNFKQQIKEMDGNFIMFYAPWCHHCKEFQPIWSQFGELVNSRDTKLAIAQVDCTQQAKLCQEIVITDYPTLLYFDKNSFDAMEYIGTRDLPSLTLFLSEVLSVYQKDAQETKKSDDVQIYNGMAYLTDHNIEKFVSRGQHFVLFYVPWCRTSQSLAPIWSNLAVQYAHNPYLQVGKVNCMDSKLTCANFHVKYYPKLVWIVSGRIMGVANAETLEELKAFVDKMLLTENHDPEKFMRKEKALPVARISTETFETFLENELVFVNFFAPWCAHCMQLSPLWAALGERFRNDSRVLVADVDCVQSKPICETEKINGLPTLILYKQKKIVSVENGSKPLESLVSLVTEHLRPESQAEPELQTEPESRTEPVDTGTVTKDEL